MTYIKPQVLVKTTELVGYAVPWYGPIKRCLFRTNMGCM